MYLSTCVYNIILYIWVYYFHLVAIPFQFKYTRSMWVTFVLTFCLQVGHQTYFGPVELEAQEELHVSGPLHIYQA